MLEIKFTENLAAACESLFNLYGTKVASNDLVEDFLVEKIKAGDIELSFNLNLITRDEVGSFLISNLYTRFIMNHERTNKEPSQEEIDEIKEVFLKVLFDGSRGQTP